jgi:hypothetical protein
MCVSFCHHLASAVRRKLSHLNLLLINHWANCNQTLVEWSLDGPLPKLLICIIGINRLKENFTEKLGLYVKLLPAM